MLLEKVLAIHRKVLGEAHFRTASDYLNLATSLSMQGKYAEAEEGFRQAVALRHKVLGDDHPATAEAHNNLATDLVAQGKCAEAEEELPQGAGHQSATCWARSTPYTAQIYNSIAMNLNAQGKYAEAEAGFRKALAIYRKVWASSTAARPEAITTWRSTLPLSSRSSRQRQATKRPWPSRKR